MIEYALLFMLGFCSAGLIALLIAPTLWARAVRLTTRRLERTLPMSLSEIEADKDFLRADHAVAIRRLEARLAEAQERAADHLVENSRLQLTVAQLRQELARLELQLEERRNAANVFEKTIRQRFPELEKAIAFAKSALHEKDQELQALTHKLRRREVALSLSQRAAAAQQAEIERLRAA
jgi:chromosome segregation ATPase